MIQLKPTSWKIMLEVLVKAKPTRVLEVPIVFEERQSGQSKFNAGEMLIYFKHIVKLSLFRFNGFLKFGVVGSCVAGIHFGLLYTFTDVIGLWYILSAILSVVLAATTAYVLHHIWTFRERAIKNHATGWAKYQVVSGISDLVYIGLLAVFVEQAGLWYMLGAFLAAGMVYPIKYTTASLLVWGKAAIDPENADYDWYSFWKGSFAQRWWKRQITTKVWEWIPNSSRLLEIGCGSSPTISRYDGAIGLDVNEEKLAFMQDRFPGIEFTSGATDEFSNKTFDYVLCIEVIEHLENPEYMVSEIARLLKPGGRTVIATPDYGRKHWHLAEMFTPYKEQHIRQFTRKSLEALCEENGLVPLKHAYVAGCDLIEMFAKSFPDNIDTHVSGNENGNGNGNGKAQLAKIGATTVKRWANPSIARANLAVTYKCNQRCKSCNIWTVYRDKPSRVRDELTCEEIASIVEKNNLIWLSLTGGEPFVRKDIGDILEVCLRNLMLTSVVTNGSRPEVIEKAVRQALASSHNMLTLNVSLEGPEEFHDEFTGVVGSWEKATETLKRLSLIKCNRFRLGIEHLLSEHTLGQAEYVSKVASGLNVSISYTIEQEAGLYRNVGREIGKVQLPHEKFSLEFFQIANMIFMEKAKGGISKACVAGEYSCFIDPYGVVFPCIFLTPKHPIKSLRETEYVIGKLDCKEVVDRCKGCWTPCEACATMVFRPWRLL